MGKYMTATFNILTRKNHHRTDRDNRMSKLRYTDINKAPKKTVILWKAFMNSQPPIPNDRWYKPEPMEWPDIQFQYNPLFDISDKQDTDDTGRENAQMGK